MKTFNELRTLYEAATAPTRQRVLDMLPAMSPPTDDAGSRLARELWERALRAVFEPDDTAEEIARWKARIARDQEQNGQRMEPPAWMHRAPVTERTDQGEQIVLPGAERSARQAAAAREANGRGRIVSRRTQIPPAGLFASREETEPDLFGE